MMVLEDDSPMEAASTPSTPRNLSAWNITIPYVDFYDDDVKRERIPVFCIDVERNDRKAGEAEAVCAVAPDKGHCSAPEGDVFFQNMVSWLCRSGLTAQFRSI